MGEQVQSANDITWDFQKGGQLLLLPPWGEQVSNHVSKCAPFYLVKRGFYR